MDIFSIKCHNHTYPHDDSTKGMFMGALERIVRHAQRDRFPETIEKLYAKMERNDPKIDNAAIINELLTPGPKALPAPVMLQPVHQRWVFFGLSSGAFYTCLYGTGILSA